MKIQPDLGPQVPPSEAPATPKEMLSVRFQDGKCFVRINYSSLSLIQTCLRKASYSLDRSLKSRKESSALIFGTAIHKALELFYSAPANERTLPANFISDADLALGSGYENDALVFRCLRAFVEKAEPLRALPDSDKRSLNAGVWLLTHHFKTYIDDPFVVFRDELGPVTERFSEAVLYDSKELQITYFGTIDVVLINERTGVILPADHKTSSVVGTEFYSRLKPNAQYSGYVFLCNQALGLKVDSFLVNCLQVKSRPVTARGQPPQFPRQVTRRTEEDLAEFRDLVVHYVRSYLASLGSGYWPQADVNSCSMYRGCQYLDVCASPAALRENILEANFASTAVEAADEVE